MAIDPEVAERQKAEIKRLRGEETVPEPPKVDAPPPEEPKKEKPSPTLPYRGRSHKAIHMIAFKEEFRKRYAQSVCGRVIGLRRQRTIDRAAVTCEECLKKMEKKP